MSLKIKERRRARFHAIQALYQKHIANTSIVELKFQFHQENINRHAVEWDFFYRLLEGVDSTILLLDKQINIFAVYNIDSINIINLSILRLGTYEIINFLEIPYQVILSEYTKHAKCFGTESGYRFINGILEKIALEIRNSN